MWSSKHRPTQVGALGCASSRAGARSTTWELGTFLLHHEYYILTTCEPHRFFNRRDNDNAWARVFFVARLGLECSGF
jgi:hypothetical protein